MLWLIGVGASVVPAVLTTYRYEIGLTDFSVLFVGGTTFVLLYVAFLRILGMVTLREIRAMIAPPR